MGCDIHVRCEFYGPTEDVVVENGQVKVAQSASWTWQPAEKLTPNHYRQRWLDQLAIPYEDRLKAADSAGQNTKYVPTDDDLREWIESEPQLSLAYGDRFYTGRNYALFYKLSGVRGEFEDITPMKGSLGPWETNGLPEDVSEEVGTDLSEDDPDLHSHTHYTLTELLEEDWKELDEQFGSSFYSTILQMQAVAIERCNGDTDRVRLIMAYDN